MLQCVAVVDATGARVVGVLKCYIACCSVLQRVAVWCGVLRVEFAEVQQDTHAIYRRQTYISVMQCAAVCCSVLQCVAVCCSVLHCVAVCCSVLQCLAVSCSVLQCSVLRCNAA